jgi:hypothetical protein
MPGSAVDMRRRMPKHTIIPNMRGTYRPQLTCDNLGYPIAVGDEEWETKHKQNYVQVSGGWRKKCACCDSK